MKEMNLSERQGRLVIFRKYIRWKSFVSLLSIAMLVTIWPLTSANSYAAAPHLDDIRVALFIQARGSIPAVTLSSPEGLQLGIRTPANTHIWVNGIGSMRGAIDQYMLYLAETGDYQAASKLRNEATAFHQGAYIFAHIGPGGPMYQVAVGPFPAKQDAERTREALIQRSIVSQAQVRIGGPLYWSAGTHDSIEAAEQQLASITASGLPAVLSIHENEAGQVVYSVWLEGQADQAALAALKTEAVAKLPSISLIEVDIAQPYLLKRTDVTNGLQSSIPFFSFNGAGQRVWVEPVNGQITVQERYGRSYRGGIELSQYSGQLAVINELPFESYLYSVVGSEMAQGWPLEALKAQAVAARTYALSVGVKYNIAHVSDTTYEQAYRGTGVEFPAAIQAVDATRGEVLVNHAGLIEALYYSNAGGLTADPTEIWGRKLDFAVSVPSPDDNAQAGLLHWNRVILPSGEIGFVRSDYTRDTGRKTPAGLAILEGTANNVNVRKAPFVDDSINPPITRIQQGDEMILLEQRIQSNPFQWVYGPYSAAELLTSLNRYASAKIEAPLHTLEVTARGPSGRVTQLTANGTVVEVTTPDTYRSALRGLPSTRFDIESAHRFSVLSGDGSIKTLEHKPGSLHVLRGNDRSPSPMQSSTIFAINHEHEARVITEEPAFRFIGSGFGHGVGLSQYGAKEMAEFLEYDYQQILKYYYQGVDIVKTGQ